MPPESIVSEGDLILTCAQAVCDISASVADYVMARRPELDRDGLRKAVARELHMAIGEMVELSNRGAVLSDA